MYPQEIVTKVTIWRTSSARALSRPIRNLSRRSRHCCRFNLLLASIDSLRALPASQDSPLDYRFLRSPQPQSSQTASRGRFSPLLVSNDSLTSFSPTVNAPLGHRFSLRNLSRRSGHHWRFNPLLASIDSLRALPASQDSPLGYRFLHYPQPQLSHFPQSQWS